MYRVSKPILIILTLIVGALYIISGLIKLNDPLGFAYKLQEYFEVGRLSFLSGIAVGLAIFIAVAEVVLGAFLLLGFYNKKTLIGLLVSITFFTVLTFLSAIFKVVSNCGCFGDALPLTPWQSFIKDVVLLIFIWVIYQNRALLNISNLSDKSKKIIAYFLVGFSFAMGVFTLNFLPIIDFLPYKVGVNITDAMLRPDGAPKDEYDIQYTLKNTVSGEIKKYDKNTYVESGIWKDTTWAIDGTPARKLVKKGFTPPISDLTIKDAFGTDYTSELIENPYFNLIIVVPNLTTTNKNALGNMNALALNVSDQFNIRTIIVTSSSPAQAMLVGKDLKLFPEVFYADNVPVKSMVRANPGIMLLKNGEIINKWHFNSLPSFEELSKKYFQK